MFSIIVSGCLVGREPERDGGREFSGQRRRDKSIKMHGKDMDTESNFEYSTSDPY